MSEEYLFDQSRGVHGLAHNLQLRTALLQLLAEHGAPMTTAQLRTAAHHLFGDDAAPVVQEPVYRALLALQRTGDVRPQRTQGRHVLWTLTPIGAHAAQIAPQHGGQS